MGSQFVVCPDRILRYYANANRVGEVMLDDDGDPRLNYNNKVVRAYPEPNQTQFVNCESAALGINDECDAACESLRIGCVSTHLSCAGCPDPIEAPEAEYRFPDKEWLFSDPALGGFNQILWATVLSGSENTSVADQFDMFVAVPSPGQIILRAYRFRAGQVEPEAIAAPAGPTRTVEDFSDPVFFQDDYLTIRRTGPPVRIKNDENGAQAHMVFTEGGAAVDEQEYVSREILTGSNVDQIQFSPFTMVVEMEVCLSRQNPLITTVHSLGAPIMRSIQRSLWVESIFGR